MNINKITVAGRLCADPELRYLPSQSAVVNIRVATNRKWKTEKGEERDEATYFECVGFGKLGENVNQYFSKGREIYIEGRMRTESWDDKQAGQKRSKMVLVMESFQFVGPKPADDGAAPRQPAKPKPQTQTFDPTEDVQFSEPDVPF